MTARTASVVALVGAALALAGPAAAQPAPKGALAPLSFLVGRWVAVDGTVGDAGGRARGTSVVSVEAQGGVLLRRDHTELASSAGRPTGGFDQIMMIYPDEQGVRAEYEDGAHLIHYAAKTIEPGAAVVFESVAPPGAPHFMLSYRITDPQTMTVTFGMQPPGGAPFATIAKGVLRRAR